MEKIMLLILSVARAEVAIRRALELANQNDSQLKAVIYLKKEIPTTLTSSMRYSGYLGEKIQEDVKNTIRDEYHKRIEDLMDSLREQTQQQGLELDIEVIREGSLKRARELINNENVDYLIINYTQNKFTAQVISDKIDDDFLNELSIPFELYRDGEAAETR